jgi:LytS/YehU family sensor histidine kinase
MLIAGVALGILAGFSYYYFVGCASGSCLITANPIISSGYGGLIGGLVFSMFSFKKKKQENE